MNIEAHLTTLASRKSVIEKAILDETHRPAPDSVRLSMLKREKLRLKEEIESHHPV